MKILLANNTLSLLAGSETWTYTLALALKRAGHQVACFSPTLGEISRLLEKESIHCFKNISTQNVEPFSFILKEDISHNYDAIIANHWNIVEFLRSQFPTTPIISTIHGVMHFMDEEQKEKAPEHPALNSGVNQFVAVSEEVQQMLQKNYNIEATLIRNFIDINHFKKIKVNKKPVQILVNSNYATKDDPEVNVIREVANHYGARLTAIGQNFVQTLDTQLAIKDADIVVGMGRSVLEGIAMGRMGIVHGRWGTGGILKGSTSEELKLFNFSGRNSDGKFWTKEKFIEEIDKAIEEEVFGWGPLYVASNHNAKRAAESYIKIIESLLGKDIVKDDRRPFIRARDKKKTGVAKSAK